MAGSVGDAALFRLGSDQDVLRHGGAPGLQVAGLPSRCASVELSLDIGAKDASGRHSASVAALRWDQLCMAADVPMAVRESPGLYVSVYNISAGMRSMDSISTRARYTADANVEEKGNLLNTGLIHFVQREGERNTYVPEIDRTPLVVAPFHHASGSDSILHLPSVRDGLAGIWTKRLLEKSKDEFKAVVADIDTAHPLALCCQSYDRQRFAGLLVNGRLDPTRMDECRRLARSAMVHSGLLTKDDTLLLSVYEELLSSQSFVIPGRISFAFTLELQAFVVETAAAPKPLAEIPDVPDDDVDNLFDDLE